MVYKFLKLICLSLSSSILLVCLKFNLLIFIFLSSVWSKLWFISFWNWFVCLLVLLFFLFVYSLIFSYSSSFRFEINSRLILVIAFYGLIIYPWVEPIAIGYIKKFWSILWLVLGVHDTIENTSQLVITNSITPSLFTQSGLFQ